MAKNVAAIPVKAATPAAPAPATKTVAWISPKGNFVRMSKKQFPRTLEGRIAWCDYSIALLEYKKTLAQGSCPRTRFAEQISRKAKSLGISREQLSALILSLDAWQ